MTYQRIKDLITNKFAKNFGIYFAGNLVAQIIPLIVLPIVTMYLVPAEYGVWALFLMMVTMLAPMMTLGGQMHLSRNFKALDKEELANHFYNLLFQKALLVVLLLCVALSINMAFDTFLSVPAEYLYLVPICAVCFGYSRILANLKQFEEKPYHVSAQEIAGRLLNNGLALFFVVVLSAGWAGMVWGYFTGYVIIGLYGLWYMRRHNWLKRPFQIDVTKAMLAVNAPLIPHLMLTTIQGALDRIMLESLMSVEEVGLYSVGYALGNAIFIVFNAGHKVWQAWATKMLTAGTSAHKAKIVKTAYMIIAGMAIAAVGVSIAAYLYIIVFLDEQYADATRVVFWIALVGLPSVMTQTCIYCLNFNKKTGIIPLMTFISIIINIGLNYLLIPMNGMVGAAQATLLGSVFTSVIVLIALQRRAPMPWLRFRSIPHQA